MTPNDYTLTHYQTQARRSRQQSKSVSVKTFMMLGLAGEVGSLLSSIKKQQRDSIKLKEYKAAVVEEFGDCLWYISAICDDFAISLNEIAGITDDRFSQLQQQRILPFSTPSLSFENKILSIFEETGKLSAKIVNASREEVMLFLQRIFSIFVDTANETGADITEIAMKNIEKVNDRWPQERIWDVDFDRTFPPYERLPNGFIVDMYEREIDKKTYLIQSSGGVFIGDRLTDNIMQGDDYRFHDVFHYAYAAVLGWSPTTRALLKRKRKSESKIDEGEDSARAVIIEEGIATFIFGQAKKADFFKDEKQGDMSFALLKQVRQFVEGFEPEICPLWLWEDAILQGCQAFRFLQKRRKARLTVDRTARVLRVEDLADDPDAIFG